MKKESVRRAEARDQMKSRAAQIGATVGIAGGGTAFAASAFGVDDQADAELVAEVLVEAEQPQPQIQPEPTPAASSHAGTPAAAATVNAVPANAAPAQPAANTPANQTVSAISNPAVEENDPVGEVEIIETEATAIDAIDYVPDEAIDIDAEDQGGAVYNITSYTSANADDESVELVEAFEVEPIESTEIGLPICEGDAFSGEYIPDAYEIIDDDMPFATGISITDDI